MKSTALLLMLCLAFTGFAQTNPDMKAEAIESLKKTENELSNLCTAITQEYKTDPRFVKNFKKAQDAWTAYKTAQIEMKFPNRKSEYDSLIVVPLCKALYTEQLTRERIATLKVWMVGYETCNFCAGSVKDKD